MGRRSDARDRLITSASQLFRERGFSSVGVAQLCETAGVNKGSFYHFFPSKRELLIEVLARAWDETGLLGSWEEAPPERPIQELRRYLQELFAQHYADREASGRVHGSLVASVALELGSHEPVIAQQVNELLDREVQAFAALLTRAADLGEVALNNPHDSARAIVACLHGLLMLAKAKNDLQVLPGAEQDLLRLAGVET